MPRPASATSIMRRLAADGTASRVMLAPAIVTNAVGVRTAEARVLASQELQPGDGPKRIRQLDISLPPGVTYRPATTSACARRTTRSGSSDWPATSARPWTGY